MLIFLFFIVGVGLNAVDLKFVAKNQSLEVVVFIDTDLTMFRLESSDGSITDYGYYEYIGDGTYIVILASNIVMRFAVTADYSALYLDMNGKVFKMRRTGVLE